MKRQRSVKSKIKNRHSKIVNQTAAGEETRRLS
jgi:hypothetical protein